MNKLAYMILCLLCIAFTQCKTTSKTTVSKAPAAAPPPPSAVSPPAAPAPPAPQINAPASDLIATGQSVYNAKCGRCHDLPRPGDHDQSDWASIMVRMSPKAHLSDAETGQVLAFVNANAMK